MVVDLGHQVANGLGHKVELSGHGIGVGLVIERVHVTERLLDTGEVGLESGDRLHVEQGRIHRRTVHIGDRTGWCG